MNQTPQHEISKTPRVPHPSVLRIPSVQAAKWPPDDDAMSPGGMGGGAGFSDGSDDGNFKKGRFKPAVVLLLLVAIAGGAAAFFLAGKKQSEQLGAKEVAEEKKNVALLPIAEALPQYRKWAAGDVTKLQEEAFAQLAWAKDPEGLGLIIKGLESHDHRVRGTAATALLEYGSPAADSAKPALVKALKEADESDKPQIAWALAVLHETTVFEDVLNEYRAAHLSKVQRLDGNPAFDPEQLAGMVTTDRLSTLASDPSESVRQLVATVLSRNAESENTGVLIKLVEDKSVDVAREAAVGLGKIGSEQSMQPLLNALTRADKESRQKFLEALRDGVGSRGLVRALPSVQHTNEDTERFQTKLIFDMIGSLEDPRAANLLVQYIESNPPPHPHWKTEAAIRLAAIGDVRAVPTLAWRMKQEPKELYHKSPEELRLWAYDDQERVVAARMLADLAVLHPDKRGDIRQQAYAGVYYWLTDKPQPHANGLRFMAAAEAAESLPKMRSWAHPKEAFPKEGQQEFPPVWATTQSALRYIGWMKDPQSWGMLEEQLKRKPANVDATREALYQGGMAVMGMALRAVGVGASHGFAQWGDSKAYPLLVSYIEDKQNNEESRIEACFSVGWVATDDQMKEIVKKVHEFDKADPKTQFIRGCYLEALVRKPVAEATAGLIDLINGTNDLEVQHQAARAIGFGGLNPAMIGQLFEKMNNPATRTDAALALLVGGDADSARRALVAYQDVDKSELETLKVVYTQTFGYWSDRNYENGDVARWIENAKAASRVKIGDALQDWPRLILSRAIQGIEYDNGPHSVTRVQMRVRLMRDAKSGDAKKRAQAIALLKFMNERGVLMALKGEPGPAQDLARQAYFELMNPKASTDSLPEAKKGKGSDQGANVLAPKP